MNARETSERTSGQKSQLPIETVSEQFDLFLIGKKNVFVANHSFSFNHQVCVACSSEILSKDYLKKISSPGTDEISKCNIGLWTCIKFQAEEKSSLKKGDKQTNKNKQAILQPSSTNKLGQAANKSTRFANLYWPIVRHRTCHYFWWEIACPDQRRLWKISKLETTMTAKRSSIDKLQLLWSTSGPRFRVPSESA